MMSARMVVMRPGRWAGLGIALGLAVGIAGCDGNGADLVVELRTDMTPGVDFTAIQTDVLGTARSISVPAFVGDAYASDFVVVADFEDVPMGQTRLRVSLLTDDGSTVVDRTVSVLVEGSTGVQVLITRRCQDVMCPDDETCVRGECVPQECVTGTEDVCPDAECMADGDCPASAVSCATPRCLSGSCVDEANDDMCAGGEFCSLTSGCMPVPVMVADGGMDGGGTCVEECVGGALVTCGSGGPTSTPCALGCADDGSRCARLVPSNLTATKVSEIRSGPEPAILEVRDDLDYDTRTCPEGERVTMADGSSACLRVVSRFAILPGATFRPTGVLPLIVYALGPITLEGTLDAGADMSTPGPGGVMGRVIGASGSLNGGNGEASGGQGGGGGGALCGSGGEGGMGGSAAGGSGGTETSDGMLWNLVPLRGGGAGGIGASSGTAGVGGAGGGAVQLTSETSITIDGGRIVAGGGGGTRGIEAAGSGGGAGGAVLLEAPTVRLDGGALIGVGGGGGAAAIGIASVGMTGDGENGGARAGAGGDATSGAGGAGGGDELRGDAGGSDPGAGGSGGGGGGGAGCILVRANDFAEGTHRTLPTDAPGFSRLTPVVE
jgi:hypothetical protein